jgi:hypothetical protein
MQQQGCHPALASEREKQHHSATESDIATSGARSYERRSPDCGKAAIDAVTG